MGSRAYENYDTTIKKTKKGFRMNVKMGNGGNLVVQRVMEDVEEGVMAPRKGVADVFLQSHVVARRIPVVTQKADGSKKVRGVDHFSEKWGNGHCWFHGECQDAGH